MRGVSIVALCLLCTPVAGQEDGPEPMLFCVAAVSADGSLVAAARRDGQVILLDAANGEHVRSLTDRLSDEPWALEFAPDSRFLAGVSHDGKLRLWTLPRVRGGRAPASVPREAVPDRERPAKWAFGITLLWSPNGERLVVADADGHASLWSASGERIERWEQAPPKTDESMAWSRDGSVLFTADGLDVALRDAVTGEPRTAGDVPCRVRCPEPVVVLAVHPTKNRLVTGHRDSLLIVWDLDTGRVAKEARFRDEVFPEPEDEVASIVFTTAGDRLGISTRSGNWVLALDAESLEVQWRSGFLGAHFGEATRVAWSPGGERLWFAYECCGDDLSYVVPQAKNEPDTYVWGGIPHFGKGVGVIVSDGVVHAVRPDGSLSW